MTHIQRIQPQASSHVAAFYRTQARAEGNMSELFKGLNSKHRARTHAERAFAYARDAIREDRNAEVFRIVG